MATEMKAKKKITIEVNTLEYVAGHGHEPPTKEVGMWAFKPVAPGSRVHDLIWVDGRYKAAAMQAASRFRRMLDGSGITAAAIFVQP